MWEQIIFPLFGTHKNLFCLLGGEDQAAEVAEAEGYEPKSDDGENLHDVIENFLTGISPEDIEKVPTCPPPPTFRAVIFTEVEQRQLSNLVTFVDKLSERTSNAIFLLNQITSRFATGDDFEYRIAHESQRLDKTLERRLQKSYELSRYLPYLAISLEYLKWELKDSIINKIMPPSDSPFPQTEKNKKNTKKQMKQLFGYSDGTSPSSSDILKVLRGEGPKEPLISILEQDLANP